MATRTTPARPTRQKKPQRPNGANGNARRLRMSDVAMDDELPKRPEMAQALPDATDECASPRLNKTLFSGNFSDSSNDSDDGQGDEPQSHARPTSYRSRARRLTALRVSAPPAVPYSTATPVKAMRAAARRHTIECDRVASTITTATGYGSPLPVEELPTTPVKRSKAPFPGLYSPVRAEQTSPTIVTPSGDTTPVDPNVCSTMSTWSPWDSPPRKREDTEPSPMNLSFKSPVPPTPLKRRTTTPSRQRFLERREVLVQVNYSQDPPVPGLGHTAFQELETVGWLGAGVSAEVSKVYSKKQNRYFAVKKTKHELRSERERDMLLQEITIAEQLAASGANFDHLVRYYQAWQANGYLYVQTELCTGGNLRDFIAFCEGRQIPEECLWTIINHVGQGLEALHANQIVHLDIKPENIFIAADGAIKIGDLGMAAQNSCAQKRVDDLEGDAMYMAKELLSSAVRYPSADVFCLGIMMLELATGVALPAEGDDWHLLRNGHLPPLPQEYSQDLVSAIAQMMHADPSMRPTATEIVNHPHILPRSAPALILLEHAQHYQSVAVRKH